MILLNKIRMIASQNQMIHRNRQRFLSNTAKLDAMSPLKVLSRGYAMVQTEENSLVRSVNQVKPGDQLSVLVSDGSLSVVVSDKKE